jgi:hypothetical protein
MTRSVKVRLACLGAFVLIAFVSCAKKTVAASTQPSVSESPSPEPPELIRGFGSEASFTEPDAGARFAVALAGTPCCPPILVRGALACAIEDRIVFLERDGTDRSIALPGRSRKILCSYEAKGRASIAVLMDDGGLISLDYDKLTTVAQVKGNGAATSCALSGFKILRACGKRVERFSLPGLESEESAESPSEIALVAANGSTCLLFCGGESLKAANYVDSRDVAAGLETVSAPLAPDSEDVRVVWIAPLGSGFLALLADGRAAFLEKGAEPDYLPGRFEPNLDGSASIDRIGLMRPDGRLCAIRAGTDGKIETEESDIYAELAMPLDSGWLYYAAGSLGYARVSGTPLWKKATSIAPRFPPILWNGRIVLCARDATYDFPGDADQGLERSIRDALLSSEAETAIKENLATMREEPSQATEATGLDIAPYRPGVRRGFSKGWRVCAFEPEKSLSYRIRVKGQGEYFIAVFDEDGTKTLSNVGYGLDESLELTLMAGKKYAIAVAPRDPARDGEPAELSILAR